MGQSSEVGGDRPSHDDELAALAREVASELPSVYAEKARKKLSEQFHLQPATNRVVERLAPAWHPAPSLAGKKFGDKLGWIGLGHVDTVFTWGDGTRTFLELRWALSILVTAHIWIRSLPSSMSVMMAVSLEYLELESK